MDIVERYKAAEKLMPWHIEKSVLNGEPAIIWLDDTFFYYADEYYQGENVCYRFVKVNAGTGEKAPLFDQQPLEKALAEKGRRLPKRIGYSEKTVSFTAGGFRYTYDLETKTLTDHGVAKDAGERVSPDGKWAVVLRDFNLVLIDKTTGKETRVTTDGEENYSWGIDIDLGDHIKHVKNEVVHTPEVLWSHDSKKFLTYRCDARLSGDAYVLETCFKDPEQVRPKLYTYKYPLPQDKYVPTLYPHVYDLEKGVMRKVDGPCSETTFALYDGYKNAMWMPDDSEIYWTLISRGHDEITLNVIDAETLKTRTVIRETSDTFVNRGQMSYNGFAGAVQVLSDKKRVIWWSERDDQARLFLYDYETGECLHPFTPAGVNVESLKRVDEKNGLVYFTATCIDSVDTDYDDPYFHALCVASLDGKTFRILTPENAEHKVSLGKKYFADTFSRVDMPPVTVVRDFEGNKTCEVVAADVTRLMELGYVMPIRFKVKARDGKTDIYGIMIPPADLEEGKLYPMVEYHYGGPSGSFVPKEFTWHYKVPGWEAFGGLQSYAHLGMCGMILDGFSTGHRGRKIHEVCFHNIGDACGLEDHVKAGPQIKKLFPFVDIDRVGMCGSSGGGFGTARALLAFPDYYKVGVSSAGNHDQRLYHNGWSESFDGLYDPEVYAGDNNCNLAANLKGKLLIVHGMMDDNVMIAQSLRLMQALIENNKDFDFICLPTLDHYVPGVPYYHRKKMDYFVKHLTGQEPPKDFLISPDGQHVV